jgi:aryl-alcohol dehydrogenase-like predicted oxidoreductase
MLYRRMGRSGLRLSAISLGSWVTFGTQLDVAGAVECMAAAYDVGINFFDNAEQYAGGEAERLMGAALARLGWRRSSYVVATKFYWGLHDGVNESNTLNRKYLRTAIDGSLTRLALDHVDLVFCHRPDPHTPIEETVWAMHDMIESGRRCTGARRSGRRTALRARGILPNATISTSRSSSNRGTTC